MRESTSNDIIPLGDFGQHRSDDPVLLFIKAKVADTQMIFQKLNNMKKSTAAVLAVLLIAACAADVYQTRKAEIEAMQNAGVSKLAESVDLESYREVERGEIQKILDDTEAAIRESADDAEIDSLIEKAVSETAGFKTDAEYTTEEGVAKLKDAVDLELYREAEQSEIKKMFDSTEGAVLGAKDKAEIDALIDKYVSQCAEFKTDAEYTAEEEAARAAAAASSKSKKKKSSGSKGCVGTSSDVFN